MERLKTYALNKHQGFYKKQMHKAKQCAAHRCLNKHTHDAHTLRVLASQFLSFPTENTWKQMAFFV